MQSSYKIEPPIRTSLHKHWRNLFCRRFGLVEGIRHLVAACDGRTIAGGELRLAKVRAYAQQLGLGDDASPKGGTP